MGSKKFVRLLAATALSAAIVAGHSAVEATAPPADTAEPTPGGTLRYSQLSAVDSLDPATISALQASQLGGTQGFAIFGALLLVDTETGDVIPFMAESVETPDDGTTWELTLRDGLEFSDGTPFDAEAVKFNWDRIADPEVGSTGLSIIGSWTSYEVTGPLTITITLPTPSYQLPRLIAHSFSFIGSPTAIEELGPDFATRPIGAGPFVVDDFIPGEQLTVSRNPTYFDSPRPYVDQIVFRTITLDDQRLNSFTAGEDDVSYFVSTAAATSADEAGDVVLSTPPLASAIAFNAAQPPMDDPRVRQALVIAADRTGMCTARQQQPCEEDDVPTSLFATTSPYYDPSGDLVSGSTEDAQALVDQYLSDAAVDQLEVTYTFVAGSDIALNVATVFKASVEQLENVTVTLDPIESAAFFQTTRDGTHQIATSTFRGNDPGDSLPSFFRTGGQNASVYGYSNEEMDAALDLAGQTADENERIEAYQTVGRLVSEEALLLPYFFPTVAVAYRDNVNGLALFADTGVRWDEIWLDQ